MHQDKRRYNKILERTDGRLAKDLAVNQREPAVTYRSIPLDVESEARPLGYKRKIYS